MSDRKQNKQITSKYGSALKGKARAAVDKIRSKGISDEANCVNELLFLCEHFEKSAETLASVEKEKNAEITKLITKNEFTEKNINALNDKLLLTQTSKSILQLKLQEVSNTLLALEKDKNALALQIEDMKGVLRLTSRQRSVALNNIKKLEIQLNEKAATIKEGLHVLEAHKNEIKNLKNSIQKINTEFSGMKKDRDRNAYEMELSSKKIKKKDAQLIEMFGNLAKSKASQETCRLQSIDLSRKLDASISERIIQQRDITLLTKRCDEIEEDRRKTNTENDALKQNVLRLEAIFHASEKEIQQLKRTNTILKTDLEKSISEREKLNLSLQQKLQDVSSLNNAIVICEKSIAKLHSHVQDRQNEKDFIGTQIIRRNDEIALLTEKLEVTQLALDRGESQYNDRLEEVRLLTIETKNLKATVNVLKDNALKMENWKNQIAITQRELQEKKFANSRLLNELQTKINVHRWRFLSAQDPNRIELIQKMHILQRRILNQTAIIAEKEKQLINANLNSSKVLDCHSKLTKMKTKINKTRRALNRKTKQLKALEAESKAHSTQTDR